MSNIKWLANIPTELHLYWYTDCMDKWLKCEHTIIYNGNYRYDYPTNSWPIMYHPCREGNCFILIPLVIKPNGRCLYFHSAWIVHRNIPCPLNIMADTSIWIHLFSGLIIHITYNKGSRIFFWDILFLKYQFFLQYSLFTRLKNIEEFVQMTKYFARPPKTFQI